MITNPLDMWLKHYEEIGIKRLHVVDLDGARGNTRLIIKSLN